jgi:competence protein ComEA
LTLSSRGFVVPAPDTAVSDTGVSDAAVPAPTDAFDDEPAFRPLPPPPSLWTRAVDWVQAHRDQVPLTRRTVTAGVVVVAVIVVILVLTVRATGATGARPELTLPRAPAASAPSTDTPAADVAVVYVVGAVQHPGIQRLPAAARVGDAVDAAGGPAGDADLDQLNLAAPVSDGDRVYVPRRGDDPDPAPGNPSSGAAVAPAVVHINTASADVLDALPGVGPSLANAIVQYRRQHGRFTSVDGLLDVPGIGPAKMAALRARVKL